MSGIDPKLQGELQAALAATASDGAAAQAKAVERFFVHEPSRRASDTLWKTLVVGLIAVLVIALVGILVLQLSDKPVDAAATVFSSSLAGLLGLFVSPQKADT